MLAKYSTPFNTISRMSQLGVVVISCVLVGLIGIVDWIIYFEFSLSAFYYFPIFLSTWYLGRVAGVIFCVLCTVVWTLADYGYTIHPQSIAVIFWNASIHFIAFIILVFFISLIKKYLSEVKQLADTDPLTGAMNSRMLMAFIQYELDGFKRKKKAFSLMFVDVDHFKLVNDHFGHQAGDKALCLLVSSFREQIRATDLIGRVGGDEFIGLFPEASQKEVHAIFERILKQFKTAAHQHNWPIGISAGIVTCRSSHETVKHLISSADQLMYLAKHQGGDRAMSEKK